MTESCKTHTLDFFVLRKAKFQLICMEPSQQWYIYMRNRKLKTELAYKSAKCNTLRQCGAIKDLPHFIHTQRGVLFVAHKDKQKSKIVVFIPYFPYVKSDLNRCFAGGKKNHNNEETPYHILWCAKKPI